MKGMLCVLLWWGNPSCSELCVVEAVNDDAIRSCRGEDCGTYDMSWRSLRGFQMCASTAFRFDVILSTPSQRTPRCGLWSLMMMLTAMGCIVYDSLLFC